MRTYGAAARAASWANDEDSQESIYSNEGGNTRSSPSLKRKRVTTTAVPNRQQAADLDSLRFLLEGVVNTSKDVARESALGLARMCCLSATPAVVKRYGLLKDILSPLQAALDRRDEALAFVLGVSVHALCHDDALAELFPPSGIATLTCMLPGADVKPKVVENVPTTPAGNSSNMSNASTQPTGRVRLKLKRRDSDGEVLADAANGSSQADVVAQARMLLNRSTVASWGLAARGAVTSADLALQILSRVANAAATGRPRLIAGRGSGSVGEQWDCTPESPHRSISLSGGAGGGGGFKEHLRSSGAVTALCRMICFAAAGQVDGKANIDEPSSSTAKCQPSVPVPYHQLMPCLRLLEMATFKCSANVAQATTFTHTSAATSSNNVMSALLLMLNRCSTFLGYGIHTAHTSLQEEKESYETADSLSFSDKKVEILSDFLGSGNNSTRAEECLLGVLRVLVNITHHRYETCKAVGEYGGLTGLLMCLLAPPPGTLLTSNNARDEECNQFDDGDDGGFSLSQASSTSHWSRKDAIPSHLKDQMNGQNSGGSSYASSECSMDDMCTDVRDREQEAGAGDMHHFDTQLLCLTALTNCIELPDNAPNRDALVSAHVCRECSSHDAPVLTSPADVTDKPVTEKVTDKNVTVMTPGASTSSCGFAESSARKESSSERKEGSLSMGWHAHNAVPLPMYLVQELLLKMKGLRLLLKNTKIRSKGNTGDEEGEDEEEPEEGPNNGTPVSPTDEYLSRLEADDLVMAGHLSLVLGCLCTQHSKARDIVIAHLPERSLSSLANVLRAFLALQKQAEVLTGEMALPVFALIEELESGSSPRHNNTSTPHNDNNNQLEPPTPNLRHEVMYEIYTSTHTHREESNTHEQHTNTHVHTHTHTEAKKGEESSDEIFHSPRAVAKPKKNRPWTPQYGNYGSHSSSPSPERQKKAHKSIHTHTHTEDTVRIGYEVEDKLKKDPQSMYSKSNKGNSKSSPSDKTDSQGSTSSNISQKSRSQHTHARTAEDIHTHARVEEKKDTYSQQTYSQEIKPTAPKPPPRTYGRANRNGGNTNPGDVATYASVPDSNSKPDVLDYMQKRSIFDSMAP